LAGELAANCACFRAALDWNFGIMPSACWAADVGAIGAAWTLRNCGCLSAVAVGLGLANDFPPSPIKVEKIPDGCVCGRIFGPFAARDELPISSSYETGVTLSRRLFFDASSSGAAVPARKGFRHPLVLVADSAWRLTKFTLEAGSAATTGPAAASAKEPKTNVPWTTCGK